MDEFTFWLGFWRSIITGIVIIVISFSGCTIHQNKQVLSAIQAGVSPERARIAFSSQASEGEKIAALLTNKKGN